MCYSFIILSSPITITFGYVYIIGLQFAFKCQYYCSLKCSHSLYFFLFYSDFPVQQIDLPGDVTALAGAEHTLVCTATKNASLSTAVLEVEWLGPNGPLVNGQDDITIAGEPSTMDNTLTSSLTFTNLVTSQGGMYTCSVNLTISEANVTEHNVRRKSSVKIQSECLNVFSVDQLNCNC